MIVHYFCQKLVTGFTALSPEIAASASKNIHFITTSVSVLWLFPLLLSLYLVGYKLKITLDRVGKRNFVKIH